MSKGQCPVELKVEKLTTGCKTLDTFLRGKTSLVRNFFFFFFSQFAFWQKRIQCCLVCTGGILNRGITEIAGESASGKTQLCLQLCLSVQLPKQLHGFDAGNFSLPSQLAVLLTVHTSNHSTCVMVWKEH